MKFTNSRICLIRLLCFALIPGLPFFANAQAKPDTTRQKKPGAIVPFKQLIPDSAITRKGLFNVHQVQNRCYLEIPDSLFARPFLLVNRISKGAADGQSRTFGYAGDTETTLEGKFEKGPYNKVFLRGISAYVMAGDSSENGVGRSFDRSSLWPIILAFDVKAFGAGRSVVIDLTDYLNSDNELMGFSSTSRTSLGLQTFHPDKSYIEKVDAFPLNVEIKTIKSYTRRGIFPVTYELNTSIVLLPEQVMRYRSGDERIGYFPVYHRDLDLNPQGISRVTMITRWRMEPAPADIPRYLRGELVEPLKPIVFYIDPLTPKKWVPWLIRGVNDWQKAFEKAGFKNAIYALEAPLDDSTWSLEDARHNVIVYKPSDVMNASGPHIHDPRSGEILESHINWYHNVMSLLQEWYFVQTAAVDPQARKFPLDDTLMGKLIRCVAAHEVGHTLGLKHNFGASTAYPVDSLRNPAFLKINGHTPSIMDYARFNYIAQPGDHIPQDDLIPRIGVYDQWAIEYGYRWFPPMPEAEEAAKVKKWMAERLDADKRLWFGTEVTQQDPRCLSEDLGDDAAKAGTYGIRNLKYIMKHLVEWAASPDKDEDYSDLKRMQTAIIDQYDRYLMHAARQLASASASYKNRVQKGDVFSFLGKEKQRTALAFLNEELFTTPQWLADPKVFRLVGGSNSLGLIGKSQQKILAQLLSASTFGFMDMHHDYQPDDAYTFPVFLQDLKKYIWKEIDSRQPIDPARRVLQKRYIAKLQELMDVEKAQRAEGWIYNSDLLPIVKDHLRALKRQVNAVKLNYPDQPSRLHLQEIDERLKDVLYRRETIAN